MQPVSVSTPSPNTPTTTSTHTPSRITTHAVHAAFAITSPPPGSGHSLRTVEPAGNDPKANLDQHRLAKPVTPPSRVVRVLPPIRRRVDVVEISPAAQRLLHAPNTLEIASHSHAQERDSHPSDEAESTVVLTPVINDLLEHQPGDVPFSTHLELENDRARLLADARFRAGQEALGIAGLYTVGPAVDTSAQDTHRPDTADEGLDARDVLATQTQHTPPAMPKAQPDRRALAKQAVLAQKPMAQYPFIQQHNRLPVGGLIDLVM